MLVFLERIVVFPQSERAVGVLTSSVDFQIHLDEVEDDSEVILIWDFDVDEINLSLMTASQSVVKPQTSESAQRLPIMPLLDLSKVVCNCGKLKTKISVPLKLRFEPMNRRDETAILVLAYPVNSCMGIRGLHTWDEADKSNPGCEE